MPGRGLQESALRRIKCKGNTRKPAQLPVKHKNIKKERGAYDRTSLFYIPGLLSMKIIESGNFVPVFFECQQENQTDHSAAEDFAETDGQHL